MDIFEYNEVRWPTRALQQEEEQDAVPLAAHNLLPPSVKWKTGYEHNTQPHLLVVGISSASSALFNGALGSGAQEVGQVVLPTVEGQQDAECTTASLHAPSPGVIVCCCSTTITPLVAGAWARGVLHTLKPQRLLLLASIQATQYRGEADASQELLAFALRSTALREQQQHQHQQPLVPYLPSGSIVSDLPAALLTQAELASLPAELLVVVEQVPSLVPETLMQLAKLVAETAKRALPEGGCPQWTTRLLHPHVVDQARKKLQRTVYMPSSVYS